MAKKLIFIAPLIITIILVGELIVLARSKSKLDNQTKAVSAIPTISANKPVSEEVVNQPWQSLEWRGHKIEEKIILDTPAEVQKVASMGVIFELNTHGLTYKDVNKGVWYFYDSLGEAIFRIPKSYALDAQGSFTNDVSIKVFDQESEGKTKTLVQLTIDDQDWLTSPSRVLPISIQLVLEVVPEKR